jgi:hypothetical protein
MDRHEYEPFSQGLGMNDSVDGEVDSPQKGDPRLGVANMNARDLRDLVQAIKDTSIEMQAKQNALVDELMTHREQFGVMAQVSWLLWSVVCRGSPNYPPSTAPCSAWVPLRPRSMAALGTISSKRLSEASRRPCRAKWTRCNSPVPSSSSRHSSSPRSWCTR